MKKDIVLVDMDGVLADFNRATISFLRKKYPEIKIPEMSRRYVHENFEDIDLKKDILNLHIQKGYFLNLKLIKNAKEGWQRIIDLGYKPIICSSPLTKNPYCEQEKRQWLKKYFGETVSQEAIISSDKYLHDGIALIDDNPDIEKEESASWQHVIFATSYNENVDNKLRIKDWQDENLATVLEKCRQNYYKNNTNKK